MRPSLLYLIILIMGFAVLASGGRNQNTISTQGKNPTATATGTHRYFAITPNNAKDVHKLKVFESPSDWVSSVAFIPNGTILATAIYYGNKQVRLWEVGTGSEIASLSSDTAKRVDSVAFSPDGSLLAFSSGNDILLWSTNDVLQQKQAKPSSDLKSCGGNISSIAFSSDGTLLAAGDDSGIVCLWNVNTSRILTEFENFHASGVTSIANVISFSPDNSRIASVRQDGIGVWDIKNQKDVFVTQGKKPVVFSPDGRTLATFANDKGDIQLLNATNGEKISLWSSDNSVYAENLSSLVFSPDGRILAAGYFRNIILWEVDSGRELTVLDDTGSVSSLAFNSDGSLLASGHAVPYENIQIWGIP